MLGATQTSLRNRENRINLKQIVCNGINKLMMMMVMMVYRKKIYMGKNSQSYKNYFCYQR